MSLRPIVFHIFSKPLPYLPALALQEKIHAIQARSREPDKEYSQTSLSKSTHPDTLLLLEHRPVYTAGRRQDAQQLEDERLRLVKSGADWLATQRGGETTYHGPGQIVGYPLFDLTRMGIRTRDHVCKTQTLLKSYLHQRHQVPPYESSHTGVFFSETEKLASIGMQVRHGLTAHGFAVNITREPLAWFDQVIACGLADVKAASVQSVREKLDGKSPSLDMQEEKRVLAKMYGDTYGKEIRELQKEDGEIWEAVQEMEEIAAKAGEWHSAPSRV
ncbi:hypothetical protein M408DRAFT_14532 [Serendipita vermifera MAFF 305830]|uniref:lipoyl(octanoyl) transferase n=1 Tax=Serendipita vermifera MAFF 305830 TaxID=933852 RepID=A0A0C3B818_SERVB|nr:hypothetical protein M408DRAFT_14532 [Serendipita vermifera MAFF 305830]